MNWLRSTGLRLLLAIGLALALWGYVAYVANPDQHTVFPNVTVAIHGLDPQLAIVDQNDVPIAVPQIAVGVDASPDVTIQSNDVAATIDLSKYRPSPDPQQVTAPVALSLNRRLRATLSADPAQIKLRLEQILTRTVSLTVEVTGSVQFSFERGVPQVTLPGQHSPLQTTAQVRGPANQVNQVAFVRANADIDGRAANYTSSLKLEAVTRDGAVLSAVVVTPESADVLVPIRPTVGIKPVPVIAHVSGYPAAGYVLGAVRVSPQLVTLTGSSGLLDNVQSVNTRTIDITNATATLTRTVALLRPSDASLRQGEPISATVQIEILPIHQPFDVILPVTVNPVNTPEGLLLSVVPQVVQLHLTGDGAALSALDPHMLQGTLNLHGLNPGTYTLTPSFQLPPGVTVHGAAPSVTVALRLPPSPTPTITPSPIPTATPSPTLTTTPTQVTATVAPSSTAGSTTVPPTAGPSATPARP